MNAHERAPRALRRLATLATCATTVLALSSLPAAELPLAWLLAFTLPGAVLGGWSRLTRSPWRRALLAVTLQASACWAALETVGPMSRPAALACTILPPLAFLAIVLDTDRFHLQLARTLETGCNHWLLPGCVVGELVSGNLPLPAAAATAPPEGIATFGAPI